MCDIPVHCVIEALADGCCMKCTANGETTGETKTLLDSFAVVSGRTPLSKLNDVVLIAMGFPQFASAAATAPTAMLPLRAERNKTKGVVLIDNWKPLTYDQITDDLETPIEHLFKHIGGNRWTLKILVSPESVKNALALTVMGESTVTGTGSVVDEAERGSVISHSTPSIFESGRTAWLNILPRYHPYLLNYSTFSNLKSSPVESIGLAGNLLLNPVTEASSGPSDHESPVITYAGANTKAVESQHHNFGELDHQKIPKSEISSQRESVLIMRPRVGAPSGPGFKHGPPVTCRLMFDPLTELPLLSEWYDNNSHPTCHDIEKYTQILNSKPYRRTYPPVSPHNVKIWFKNRRAKCKRI